jgi:predicted glutamine amidotransferase
MARLFGFVGNRADLGARVLELEGKALEVVAKGATLGWGLGFYQAGEVLLRRRPIDERAEIDVASLAKDLRADVLIGHVRAATVGNLRTENTHPFRYRQWLFAHTGTVDGYRSMRERLIESLPEFLRRNVRGDTDSELLFHLFLSFLHDAGHLASGAVDPQATRAALRSTLSLIDRLRAAEGETVGEMNLLVTDGEHMVGAHRRATMAYRVVKGRADLERLLGDDALRRARIPDMASCRFCLVASDFDVEPRGWTEVALHAMVTITRTDDPTVEPL